MRRLLFSTGFPPLVGGVPSFMYARCLAHPEGLDVMAAACEGSAAFDQRQPFNTFRFRYFFHPVYSFLGPLKRISQLLRAMKALTVRFRAQQYDVVEVVTFFPGVLAALLFRKRRKFSLVCFAHGDDVLRPQRFWYSKKVFAWGLRTVDLFVANSRYTRNLLIHAGVSSNRIVIIHPPLDFARFRRRGNPLSIKAALPPHDLMLLTICRLTPKKGIDRIIQLMPSLKKRFPNLLYVVGGEGEDLPRLKMLADDYDVKESVVFVGKISEDKIVDTYVCADVFVMLTRPIPRGDAVEGFGIVFLEAGSQRVSVVGPNIGGSGDAIIDGETGYLVNPNDLNEIKSRLVALLGNPALRKSMGEAGRKRAFVESNWQPLLSNSFLKNRRR